MVLIQPLAWEPPCAAGVALKRPEGEKKDLTSMKCMGLAPELIRGRKLVKDSAKVSRVRGLTERTVVHKNYNKRKMERWVDG